MSCGTFGRTAHYDPDVVALDANRQTDWSFGSFKPTQKWANQMRNRGWTFEQIDETIKNGEQFEAPNYVNPENGATRYMNPQTGRFVVRDNVTKEVLQVGGDEFKPRK